MEQYRVRARQTFWQVQTPASNREAVISERENTTTTINLWSTLHY